MPGDALTQFGLGGYYSNDEETPVTDSWVVVSNDPMSVGQAKIVCNEAFKFLIILEVHRIRFNKK